MSLCPEDWPHLLSHPGRVYTRRLSAVHSSIVQSSAVHYSKVQCSAVQCSAVQCSAVRCGAVQCGAVHCSAVKVLVREKFKWHTCIRRIQLYCLTVELNCLKIHLEPLIGAHYRIHTKAYIAQAIQKIQHKLHCAR